MLCHESWQIIMSYEINILVMNKKSVAQPFYIRDGMRELPFIQLFCVSCFYYIYGLVKFLITTILHAYEGLCSPRARKPSGTGGSRSWFKVLPRGGNENAELGTLMHQSISNSQTTHVICSEHARRKDPDPSADYQAQQWQRPTGKI